MVRTIQAPDLAGESLMGESLDAEGLAGASLLGEAYSPGDSNDSIGGRTLTGGGAIGIDAIGGLPARPREGQFPPMPPVGRSERFYDRLLRDADAANDPLARCAGKVGQYISLALADRRDWEHKRKCFDHVLRRHCKPPRYADVATWRFFQNLAEVVKEHAGAEALRLASAEDDSYAIGLGVGRTRDDIAADAEAFFGAILCCGDECPKWFTEQDWWQLKLLRDQWV